MNKKGLLIVIMGPTASGKTSLSVALAKKYNAEIISADARQFYREINIGTAKPSSEELSEVPHHFINSCSIHDSYSVGQYRDEVISFLDSYFQQHPVSILCGGSGLYIQAVLEGQDEFPAVDPTIREMLKQNYSESGIQYLQDYLKIVDPAYYQRVDIQNPHRLIRALEVCISSQKPYSSFLGQNKEDFPYQVVKIALDWPRDLLYDRINQRVDDMVNQGLLNEAKSLFEHRNLNALQTVGYVELFQFLEGNLSWEQAIEKIKQHSRNYAKRQMTWLRKEKELHWVSVSDNTLDDVSVIVNSIISNN
jgi:tRNA dimethylallyltransferase